MTAIKYRIKPVWHCTGLVDRQSGRPYVVAESPGALLIRLRGTRTTLELPWSMAYLRAAFLKTALANLAKGKARKVNIQRGKV